MATIRGFSLGGVLEVGLDPLGLASRLSAELAHSLLRPSGKPANVTGHLAARPISLADIAHIILDLADSLTHAALDAGAVLEAARPDDDRDRCRRSAPSGRPRCRCGALGQEPGHPGSDRDHRKWVLPDDVHQP